MLQGDPGEAEKMLSDIVNWKSDSRYWLHLAEAKWKLFEKTNEPTNATDAKMAFDKSIELGLEKQILTPGEKQRLAKLREDLSSQKLGLQIRGVDPLYDIETDFARIQPLH